MSLALYLAQGHVRGLQAMAHLTPLYFGIALAVVVLVVRRLWKTGTRVDKLKAGFDAELAVGQELDQLHALRVPSYSTTCPRRTSISTTW